MQRKHGQAATCGPLCPPDGHRKLAESHVPTISSWNASPPLSQVLTATHPGNISQQWLKMLNFF